MMKGSRHIDKHERDRSEKGACHLMKANTIASELEKMVTQMPQVFMQELCFQFIRSSSDRRSILEKPLQDVGNLKSSLDKHGHVVLNTYGYSTEYRQVERIEALLSLVERCLMDILLAVMEDKSLERELKERGLLFQQHEASDLVLHETL